MKTASRIVLALLIGLVIFSAYAQAQAPSPQVVLNTGGTTQLSSLLSKSSPLHSLLNADFIPADVDGKPGAKSVTPLKGSVGGKPFDMSATNSISGVNAAKAVAKAAGKIILPLAVAQALHDAYCELSQSGWMCDPGQPKQVQPAWCLSPAATSACFQYPQTAGDAAFQQFLGSLSSRYQVVEEVSCTFASSSQFNCRARYQLLYPSGAPVGNPSWYETSVYGRNAPLCKQGETDIPGTDGLCTDSESPRQPVTNDDQLERRIVPAVEADVPGTVKKVHESGEDLSPYAKPQQLTGPSTVVGEPQVTSTTKPDGTVETKTVTPTYHITYGPTFITTNITNTTVYGDGTVVEEDQPKDHTPPAVDPDMPPVPDLYQQKYPDGMAGVWNDKKGALDQTPLFSFLASLAPNIPDGGCPQWELPVMTGWGQWQTFDISVPCWIWDAARIVMLCTCVLLCRRLIFGG